MNLKISLKSIPTTKPKLSLDVGSNIDDATSRYNFMSVYEYDYEYDWEDHF